MLQKNWRTIHTMRVGYSSISTVDREPEAQIDALREAGCEKFFNDTVSGQRGERPELKHILGEVLLTGDTLVVAKLDRLAGSLKELLAIIGELERRKIGFVSLTDNIDTTSPNGILTLQIFGALTEFERALVRERTTAGLVKARLQGRKGGRPPSMRPSDVIVARAMMREGLLPVRDIAKRMGVSVATLYRHTGKRGPIEVAQDPIAHG